MKRLAGLSPRQLLFLHLQPGSQEMGLIFVLTLGKDGTLYLLGLPPWTGGNIVFRQEQQQQQNALLYIFREIIYWILVQISPEAVHTKA